MSKKETIKRYILFILCLFFMGIGVALTKHGELGVSPISSVANVILNSGEAFVKALADIIHKEFSNVKIAFDVSWVAFSIVLSLIFFGGELVGTREGTILSAVFTGVAVKLWLKLIKNQLKELYVDNKKEAWIFLQTSFLFTLHL